MNERTFSSLDDL